MTDNSYQQQKAALLERYNHHKNLINNKSYFSEVPGVAGAPLDETATAKRRAAEHEELLQEIKAELAHLEEKKQFHSKLIDPEAMIKALHEMEDR